nr:helix-turn-helix domain-containing protein [uncultured Oscillibacter sp.]
MRVNQLVVVVPVPGPGMDDAAVRTEVWQQVSAFLLQYLGKRYIRFEPATLAWNQKVEQPFGVILGRSDPAMFLYLYNYDAKRIFPVHYAWGISFCNFTKGGSTMTAAKRKEKMFSDYPDVVTVKQMCSMLGGIGMKTAYALLESGQIRYTKIGKSFKIPKVFIIEYLVGEN